MLLPQQMTTDKTTLSTTDWLKRQHLAVKTEHLLMCFLHGWIHDWGGGWDSWDVTGKVWVKREWKVCLAEDKSGRCWTYFWTEPIGERIKIKTTFLRILQYFCSIMIGQVS